jgi:hypothetical protein
MRRARRVIAFLLMLSLAAIGHAQQASSPSESSVDTDMTITARDDSIIPVPEPEVGSEEPELPVVDPYEPETVPLPVVLPPVTDSLTLPPIETSESSAVPGPAGK